MKTCTRCKRRKKRKEFVNNRLRADGKASQCKKCHREMTAARRESAEYREKEREYSRNYNREHKTERREYRLEYESRPGVKKMIRKQARIWWANAQVKKIYYSAKASAKEHGVPFNLTQEDIIIPDRCPILGIPLVKGDGCSGPNSPSIDRIIPALGYVKGNVHVISHRANTIKSDATVEEIEAIIRFLRARGVESLSPAVNPA